ncbi:30S ribosomal protein S24e [Candidatus Marsarchaeota archaeon]|nr:30S ribosomal protein S24e [Candidatus Marsarchaeota archaeon]MCL5405018.1 30S ribosomal protein S24e [Candidatus Marsarchaeota archaeon]
MEIKITSDKKNKIFNRREINFVVVGEGSTPSAAEVKKDLCKKLNLNPDATTVRQIKQVFGSMTCECDAVSYETPAELAQNEKKYLLSRREKSASKPQAQEGQQASA